MEAIVEKPAVQPLAAVIALPILMDKVAIKKDQDGIRKSMVKLDAAIHANAVQCMMQAEKHGDTSLMRRLLIDIVDAKSGYRRQGVIVWMRKFSPMELKGDTINLSGLMPDGLTRRPWRLEEANATHFTTMADAQERVGRPIYRDALTSKVEAAVKEFRKAVDNTLDGKPIDKSKPFYDGIHVDKMIEFFDGIENKVVELSAWKDSTRDARLAATTLAKATAELEEAEKALA